MNAYPPLTESEITEFKEICARDKMPVSDRYWELIGENERWMNSELLFICELDIKSPEIENMNEIFDRFILYNGLDKSDYMMYLSAISFRSFRFSAALKTFINPISRVRI